MTGPTPRPNCIECGKLIPENQYIRLGMDQACYRRAIREGRLEPYSGRRASPERRDADIQRFLDIRAKHPEMTGREASQAIGVSHSTIIQRMYKKGLRVNGKPKNPYHGNHEALVEDYWMLRANGGHELTMLEISSKLGVSDQTLYRALRKEGSEYEW